MISTIRFYDELGMPIGLELDGGVLRGSINFGKTSAGLVVNKTLYLYGLDNGQATNPLEAGDELRFILSGESSLFSIFTVGSDSVISPVAQVSYGYGQGLPLLCHIMATGSDDLVSTDRLMAYNGSQLIADIGLHVETVGKDDRLSVMLSNLIRGAIGDTEYKIFRSSDINEPLPDYRLINAKSKELLLEHGNIYPLLYSYKGLVNMLKFFGYSDLAIKEYWLNGETGDYKLVDVVLNEYDKLDLANNTPRAPYKKTGNFGLFYDILYPTDQVGEDGLPITERDQLYSSEEILVKLFALKEYLEVKSVGGLSTIKDIVGQAHYFNKSGVNLWHDLTTVFSVDNRFECGFTMDSNGFIDDVRHLEFGQCQADRGITADSFAEPISESIAECQVSYFEYHSETNQYQSYWPDIISNPIACKVALSADPVDVAWEDINSDWETIGSIEIFVSWDNFDNIYFYDIQWDLNSGQHAISVRGKRVNNENIVIDVLHPGTYDVKMTLHGYNNNSISCTKYASLVVSTKPLNFCSFYNLIDRRLERWHSNRLAWARCEFSWNDHIYYDNLSYGHSAGSSRVTPASLDVDSYIESIDSDYDYSTRDPNWGDLYMSWGQAAFVSWQYLGSHKADVNARAIISAHPAGSSLVVNGVTYTIPGGYDDAALAASYLMSTELANQYDIIPRTNTLGQPYLDVVSISPDNTYRSISGYNGMVIVNKNMGQTWANMGISWLNGYPAWDSVSEHYATTVRPGRYNYGNTRYFDDSHELPVGVRCFTVLDNSGARGIDEGSVTWKLYRGGQLYEQVRLNRLSYLFQEPGTYDLEVVATDNNGNQLHRMMKSYFIIKNPDLF